MALTLTPRKYDPGTAPGTGTGIRNYRELFGSEAKYKEALAQQAQARQIQDRRERELALQEIQRQQAISEAQKKAEKEAIRKAIEENAKIESWKGIPYATQQQLLNRAINQRTQNQINRQEESINYLNRLKQKERTDQRARIIKGKLVTPEQYKLIDQTIDATTGTVIKWIDQQQKGQDLSEQAYNNYKLMTLEGQNINPIGSKFFGTFLNMQKDRNKLSEKQFNEKYEYRKVNQQIQNMPITTIENLTKETAKRYYPGMIYKDLKESKDIYDLGAKAGTLAYGGPLVYAPLSGWQETVAKGEIDPTINHIRTNIDWAKEQPNIIRYGGYAGGFVVDYGEMIIRNPREMYTMSKVMGTILPRAAGITAKSTTQLGHLAGRKWTEEGVYHALQATTKWGLKTGIPTIEYVNSINNGLTQEEAITRAGTAYITLHMVQKVMERHNIQKQKMADYKEAVERGYAKDYKDWMAKAKQLENTKFIKTEVYLDQIAKNPKEKKALIELLKKYGIKVTGSSTTHKYTLRIPRDLDLVATSKLKKIPIVRDFVTTHPDKVGDKLFSAMEKEGFKFQDNSHIIKAGAGEYPSYKDIISGKGYEKYHEALTTGRKAETRLSDGTKIEIHTEEWIQEFPWARTTKMTKEGLMKTDEVEQLYRKIRGAFVKGKSKDLQDLPKLYEGLTQTKLTPEQITRLEGYLIPGKTSPTLVLKLNKTKSTFKPAQEMDETYYPYTGQPIPYTPYLPYSQQTPYEPYKPQQGYEPYQPYEPYEPYIPYKPYIPDEPYVPYEPYTPYTPYVPEEPYVPYVPYEPRPPKEPKPKALPGLPKDEKEFLKAYILKMVYGKRKLPAGNFKTQLEAHEEGKRLTDNTNFRRFKIEKQKVPKNTIKKGKTYGAEHKFFKMPKGLIQERKWAWKDTKGETKGHFNWTQIMNRAG